MDDIPASSNSGTDLDYLRGVESSTCLLLSTTPSPTPLDFKHPLSDQMNGEPFLVLTEDSNMDGLQSSDALTGDTSSSGDSNSVVQDPVSAQLINNISMLDYQTLTKTGDLIIGQNDDLKLNGNGSISNRKLPTFVNWNWNIIRKILLWVVLSALVACIAAIIAMVVTIPKACNPDLPWYQGKVFYEVFPASFNDSNKDGVGDLKGLINNMEYIRNLGVSAIRLNYIFESYHYPDSYKNISNLLHIDRSLGTLDDFQDLVKELHKSNISLILDLPVISMVSTSSLIWNSNRSIQHLDRSSFDLTSEALAFWAQVQNVNGFYLKNLEQYVNDKNFINSLQLWKQIIGYDKIFIASEKAFEKAKGNVRNVLLSRVDLIDVHIDLSNGVDGLKKKITEVISGDLWSKPHYPWVHWNIGNVDTERVSSNHLNNILSLAALELTLPGTVSIFYGDELGLGEAPVHDVEHDYPEHNKTKNLVPMPWGNNDKNNVILAWNSHSDLKPNYQYLDIIKKIIHLKTNTPTIYLKSIYKDGNILKNAKVRETESNLLVVERWYPRRNTCVFVGNLGDKVITTDLSTMFYGGTVVAGTNSSLIGQVLYLNEISFPPYSVVILKLEK